MKILIISLFLNFVHMAAKSQTDPPTMQNIIPDVTDIATFSVKSANSIFVKNTIRGGLFFLYAGTDAADDGMVFSDALNRKWARQVEGFVINTQWYGMRPYVAGLSNTVNDSYSKFMAAVNYVYNHKQYNTVYVPYMNNDNKQYYFLRTITLDKDIKIIGDGTPYSPTTVMLFPKNTKGFSLFSKASTHISLENLFIQQEAITGVRDSTAHAIESRVFTYLNNIYAYNIAGDGVHIAACASAGSPIQGNADQSILERVQTFNCMNGLYIEGCDANVMDVNNCSFVNNHRWGVYDNGLLGNLFRNCHFSTNGKQFSCLVTYGGKYYVSKDSSNNVGKRPDLHPEFWYETTPMGGANAWDAAKHYYSGGAAMIVNENAYSKFDHCYTEGYQPPVILNNRSSYEGGAMGAEVKGGILTRVLNGNYIIYGSDALGTQVDKLAVGQAPATYAIELTSKNFSQMRLTSTGTASELRMANKTDGYGGIAYNDSLMLSISNSDYTTATTRQSFYPFSGDNKMDLGKPSNRWKNIYGNNLFGSKLGIGTTLTDTPTSTFQVNGSFAASYTAKTGNYNIGANDYTIDCIANTFTVTLPTAVGIMGRIYVIINSGPGTITLTTTGSQTIGNSVNPPAMQTINSGGSITVQSTGSKWRIL